MDLTIIVNSYQKDCSKLLNTINSQYNITELPHLQIIIVNSDKKYNYDKLNIIHCDRQFVNDLIQFDKILYITPNFVLNNFLTLYNIDLLNEQLYIDRNGVVLTNIKDIDEIENKIKTQKYNTDILFSASADCENYKELYFYIWKQEYSYSNKDTAEIEQFIVNTINLIEDTTGLDDEKFIYKYVNKSFLAHFILNTIGDSYDYVSRDITSYVKQLVADYKNILCQVYILLTNNDFYNIKLLTQKNSENQLNSSYNNIDNFAYVLYLSNDTYAYGVLTTYISLLLSKCKYPIYCCVTDGVNENTVNLLKAFNLLIIKVDSIFPNNISSKFYEDSTNKIVKNDHWYKAFGKISIFSLNQFKKIVYVDSDMFISKNIDELFNYPHMSAVKAGSDLDWLNSGIMVIEPNQNEFNKLLDIVYNNDDEFVFNDEGILKKYFPDWHTNNDLILSPIYNFIIFNQKQLEEEYNINVIDVKVQHYAGIKPWECSSYIISENIDTLTWEYRDSALALIHYDSLYNVIKNTHPQNKKLTVIMPTHSETVDEISKLFNSLSNQKNVDWKQVEIIVGNNNNNYLKILPYLQTLPIFKYMKLVPNNYGTIGGHEEFMLQISSGKYFWILNADDEIQNENALKTILDNIDSNPQLHMYEYHYENIDNGVSSYAGHELNCSTVWTKVIQKQYVIDKDVHFHRYLDTCEDCYYLETLTANKDFKWVLYDFPIYRHYVIPTSTGGQYTKNINIRVKCYLDIIRKLEYEIKYFEEHDIGDKIPDLIYFQFSYLYWHITQFDKYPEYKKLLEKIDGRFLAHYINYADKCFKQEVINYFNNDETSIDWLNKILKL